MKKITFGIIILVLALFVNQTTPKKLKRGIYKLGIINIGASGRPDINIYEIMDSKGDIHILVNSETRYQFVISN